MRQRIASLWRALVPPRVPLLSPFEPQPFDGTQQWFIGDLDQVMAISVSMPPPHPIARIARNPVVAGSSVALAGLVIALSLGLGRGVASPPPSRLPPPVEAPGVRVAALSPSVDALFRPKGKGSSAKPKKRAKRATSHRRRG